MNSELLYGGELGAVEVGNVWVAASSALAAGPSGRLFPKPAALPEIAVFGQCAAPKFLLCRLPAEVLLERVSNIDNLDSRLPLEPDFEPLPAPVGRR